MAEDRIRIVEVGPRDGLQNESQPIETATKIDFVTRLIDAGLDDVEVTSFVHPRAVPQLADAADVLGSVLQSILPRMTTGERRPVCSALVPNAKGWERARALDVPRIAVFTAASESFVRANIRMSIAESLDGFRPFVEEAVAGGTTVRGYISTCFVCPFEGEVDEAAVVTVAEALMTMGCDEIAVSDTIGAAAPPDVDRVLRAVTAVVPLERIALHLHDTYGAALANVDAGLRFGVRAFDASAGGLGGCPYAPGASGNLATEDLVHFLERSGMPTGVDLDRLFAASSIIAAALGRSLPGRNWQRMAAACAPKNAAGDDG